MKTFVDAYINQCISAEILTSEKLKDYPLRLGNIAVVLKVYALYSKLPFVLDYKELDSLKDYKLYLTDRGYSWLIQQFKLYSLSYLRKTFPNTFANLKDLKILDTYQGLNNFKGITGENYKVGTLNKAVLIRKQGVKNIEMIFDTLVDARKELLNLTRFYPVENFTLFSIVKRKGVYYRQRVPLILESNRRGVPVNLPHLKGKL